MRRFFSWKTRMQVFDPSWSLTKEVAAWSAIQLGAAGAEDGAAQQEGEPDLDDDTETLDSMRKHARNGNHLCAVILGQSELQIESRMLCDIFEPTHKMYIKEMEMQMSQQGCMEWEARKAAGWGLDETECIAMCFHNEDLLARYDITGSGQVQEMAAAAACDMETVWQVETARAQKFARLVLHQMSVRSWTEAYHCATLPDMFAVSLHQDRERAAHGYQSIKALWGVIERAESYSGSDKAGVSRMLKGIGYHRHQLVRELIAVSQKADWNPDDKEIQSICARVFAVTGNTLYVAEDVFNHLRDLERQSKNTQAARFASYHAACHAPILGTYGMRMTKPLPADWGQDLELPPKLVNESIFLPGSHVSDERLKLRDLQRGRHKESQWRAAGSASNARSVASSFALRVCDAKGFRLANAAWAGCLLKQVGLGFMERGSDKIFISLGFESCAACGWQLTPIATETPGVECFTLDGCQENPQFLLNFSTLPERSDYLGVPLQVLVPGCQPRGGLFRGLVFKKAGPAESLLRFAVREGTQLLVEDMKKICLAHGFTPKPDKDGKCNKAEYYKAILDGLELSEDEQSALMGYAEHHPEEPEDKVLSSAFEILDPDVAAEFADIKDKNDLNKIRAEIELQAGRQCRRTAEYTTPPELKDRIPGKGEIPGISLYRNPLKQNYLAYYAGAPAGETCRRTWGFTTGRSQPEAEQLCIEWLERQHEQVTGARVRASGAAGPGPADSEPRGGRGRARGKGRGRGRR